MSLIMATLGHTKVLLLDEHTAALDPAAAELVMKLTGEVVRQMLEEAAGIAGLHVRRREAELKLRATYEDAATGLLDIARLSEMLARVKARIVTRHLDRVSPLAVPALLEISKEMVAGEAHEDILREAEDSLIADAMRVD